jgi:hypothetical protein
MCSAAKVNMYKKFNGGIKDTIVEAYHMLIRISSSPPLKLQRERRHCGWQRVVMYLPTLIA